MSKNQEYAAQYAEFAMEQMKRYGIPASVTLAQGILESSNGQSELSRLGNNHFGIKSTNSWLKNGGEFLVYTDDRPDEKFCKYDSVGDSYEHHSQFLKNNKRYEECFKLSPDDYKGWTQGIAKAGYASGQGYASNLQKIIEVNNLQKYDQQVMQELKAQGKTIGQADFPRKEESQGKMINDSFSFPLERKEFLLVTSPFGSKTESGVNSGIDIQSKQDKVLATENNGKIISVSSKGATGRSVTVEFDRGNGEKYQTTYKNLDEVNVKVGDVVKAGQSLGLTQDKLHMEVKSITTNGVSRDIDPVAYLADISEKGKIDLQVLHNGTDLLNKYKSQDLNLANIDTKVTPDEWMKKLLSSEDSGMGLGGHQDHIMEIAMTLYSGLLVLATQIDNKTEEQQMQEITQSAQKQSIDLTALLPHLKKVELQVQDTRPVLHVESGEIKIHHQLTQTELSKISQTLGNQNLSDDDKRIRIGSIVNNIVLSQQVSQNYQLGIEAQQTQAESLQRK